MEEQLQCPLFRLPAEIRAEIYRLCLTSSEQIINADFSSSLRPHFQDIPLLATELLRTCRKIHADVDIRPLYSENTFCFTEADIATNFFNSLPLRYVCLITTLVIDLRDCYERESNLYLNEQVGPQLLHYVGCHGSLATRHTSFENTMHLCYDLPGLKSLVVDIVDLQNRLMSKDPRLSRSGVLLSFIMPPTSPPWKQMVRGRAPSHPSNRYPSVGKVRVVEALVVRPGYGQEDQTPFVWLNETFQWKNPALKSRLENHLQSRVLR